MHTIRVIKSNNNSVFSRLNKLSDPPRQLFIRGEYDPDLPAIAIVGSRKHSTYGKVVTEKLAGDLSRAGINIVSGLAIGIDSLAHRAALTAGGTTAAVMPGGVDRVYPASHRNLAEDMISANGALISEYPSGTLPARHHFVARNRIVAALSDAVLVVEAAAKSGTLITAEYALDMGLPVLAVPGPITSPTSVGTNRLIDMGAKLVTTADDILMELGLSRANTSSQYAAGSKLGQAIVDCLRSGPLSVNDLASLTKSELSEVNRELTHLELDSAVVSLGNNTWSLKSDLPAGN